MIIAVKLLKKKLKIICTKIITNLFKTRTSFRVWYKFGFPVSVSSVPNILQNSCFHIAAILQDYGWHIKIISLKSFKIFESLLQSHAGARLHFVSFSLQNISIPTVDNIRGSAYRLYHCSFKPPLAPLTFCLKAKS